nr:hypothetical protein BdHM001_35290 [Bdellovibrio sp. HM001]
MRIDEFLESLKMDILEPHKVAPVTTLDEEGVHKVRLIDAREREPDLFPYHKAFVHFVKIEKWTDVVKCNGKNCALCDAYKSGLRSVSQASLRVFYYRWAGSRLRILSTSMALYFQMWGTPSGEPGSVLKAIQKGKNPLALQGGSIIEVARYSSPLSTEWTATVKEEPHSLGEDVRKALLAMPALTDVHHVMGRTDMVELVKYLNGKGKLPRQLSK